jgi:predicted DNA-binding protein
MTVTIDLPTEFEQALQRRATEAGQDVATFVREAVMERLAEVDSPSPAPRSHAEFKERLRQIIAKHGVRCGHVDDSRESIYAGRGE